MKQRVSINAALSFILPFRLWLGLAALLGLFAFSQAHAGYVPEENYNPVWTGADAEPAEGPDWNDDEGDSVPNWLETYFETATWLADTDSDGLSDYDEIFSTGTNPILWDTNGNGLSDADDLIQPPNAGDIPPQPTADDFDGDGLPDLWELAYALNAYDPSDAAADPDGDFLTNLTEYQHSTDPNTWNDAAALVGSSPPPESAADEDQDGLPDSWELANGLNPSDAGDIADDLDGDFILNIEEYQHGSDPQVAEDFTSVMGFSIDPASLTRHDDGTERDADWDGDGTSNLSETQEGTEPRETIPNETNPADLASSTPEASEEMPLGEPMDETPLMEDVTPSNGEVFEERFEGTATHVTTWRFRVVPKPTIPPTYTGLDPFGRTMSVLGSFTRMIGNAMDAISAGQLAAEYAAGGPFDETPLPNYGSPLLHDPTPEPTDEPNMPEYENWTQEQIDGPSESGWGPTNPFTNGNVRVKGEATQEWDLEVIPLQENPPGLDFIPSGSSILIIRKIKTVRYETIP